VYFLQADSAAASKRRGFRFHLWPRRSIVWSTKSVLKKADGAAVQRHRAMDLLDCRR